MLVVSSREFRSNQKDYLDKADTGEEILIQRGKNKSYKIVPVTDDDSLWSKERFLEKINKAIEQSNNGEVTKVSSKEELKALLDSL